MSLFFSSHWIISSQARTFNRQLPFGTEAIHQLLRQEFFSTKGGANVLAFAEMVEDRRVKDTAIALMVTLVCFLSFEQLISSD